MKSVKQIWQNPAIRFAIQFIALFFLFDLGFVALYGLSLPGNNYSPFVENYLNVVHWMRIFLLHTSKFFLELSGHRTVISETQLLTAGHYRLLLNYRCLGLGIMSFFAAFVIAFPKPWRKKTAFLVGGLLAIQALNVLRLVLLALYWTPSVGDIADQHTIFNIIVYVIIIAALFIWMRKIAKPHAAN